MKKLSFMIVAAGLLATSALTSCKKEEVKPSASTNTNKNNGSLMRAGGGEWIKNVPNDDCAGNGSDCYELPPIIVTVPGVYGMITSAATSGNSGTVGSVFSSQDLQNICDHMEEAEVVKLQSGNYYLTLNHESTVAINYMVGQSFPVTAQNMEFAFQIRK